MHHAAGIARCGFKTGDIADGAVDDEADTAALLGIELDQLTDDRVGRVTLGVDHQHMPRFDQRQGLVDVEVVTGASLHCQGGAHQFAGVVIARQPPGTDVTPEVVADMRRDDALKSVQQRAWRLGRRRVDA
ncbi:hypothetical protein D3C84_777450 [compost metagenome]